MMTSLHKKEENDVPGLYDFTKEKRICMILGGFVLIKDSTFSYVLNIFWIILLYLLFAYLIITGIMTLYTKSIGKEYTVELLHEMCLFVATLIVTIVGNFTRGSQNLALTYLKTGLFLYEGDSEYLEKLLQIKQANINRFCTLKPILYRPISAFALSKTFLSPLLYLLALKSDTKGDLLNPYLPLPLYVPFDTWNPLGFGFAFLTQAMFFFLVDVIFTCHVETYVGCAMQFTAQLDILNYSLKNIENRAISKLNKRTDVKYVIYAEPEYQSCLLSCLKENIKHHLAIIRLGKVVSPYIEWTSGMAMTFFSVLVAAAVTVALQDPAGNIELLFFVMLAVLGYFTMCGVGQIITDKSAEVKDSLYSTPWPLCGRNFRVLLGIMMSNTQKPILLKAKGFGSNINFENFAEDPAGNIQLLFFVIFATIGYFSMCGVGQIITEKSAEVKDSLYSNPWPLCGRKFQILLCIMMANTQKPILLKAKGFGNNINLENFAEMTSLAYKLVNVLR